VEVRIGARRCGAGVKRTEDEAEGIDEKESRIGHWPSYDRRSKGCGSATTRARL